MAFTANEIAWSLANFALSLLVFRRTGSAWASTGFFLCAQFLPAFSAPRLVAALEHLGTRRMLCGAYAAQAVVFFALALSPSHFSLGLLLVLIFLGGSLGLFGRPVLRAAIGRCTTPVGLLREGNALLNGAFATSLLVGPLLGTALVSSFAVSGCVIVVGGLFCSMTVGIAAAGDLPGGAPQPREARGRLKAAIRHAADQDAIRRMLIFQSLALVFFSMSVPIEVVLAERALHAGATGYGALLSAWGSGAVLGSLGYARWRRLSGWTMIAVGSVCIGAGFLIMASAASIWLAVLGAGIGGIGNGTELVAERTTLQEIVEPRWMTLTLSLNESVMQALPGLGFLVGGGLAALAGPRLAFVVAGAGGLFAAVLAAVMLRGPATQLAATEAAGAELSQAGGTLEL